MFLIIGLGNPLKKYINTRHNVGFMAIDKFKENNNFPGFKFDKKSNALLSKKDNIILLKPQTFMNESGKSVKKIIKDKNIKLENLIVVHDDIDLIIGKIKIVKDRGSAGHKGVESIINELKTKNFIRIRIGIGFQSEKPKDTKNFVINNFTKEEKEIINKTLEEVNEAIKIIIENGYEKAATIYNH